MKKSTILIVIASMLCLQQVQAQKSKKQKFTVTRQEKTNTKSPVQYTADSSVAKPAETKKSALKANSTFKNKQPKKIVNGIEFVSPGDVAGVHSGTDSTGSKRAKRYKKPVNELGVGEDPFGVKSPKKKKVNQD